MAHYPSPAKVTILQVGMLGPPKSVPTALLLRPGDHQLGMEGIINWTCALLLGQRRHRYEHHQADCAKYLPISNGHRHLPKARAPAELNIPVPFVQNSRAESEHQPDPSREIVLCDTTSVTAIGSPLPLRTRGGRKKLRAFRAALFRRSAFAKADRDSLLRAPYQSSHMFRQSAAAHTVRTSSRALFIRSLNCAEQAKVTKALI